MYLRRRRRGFSGIVQDLSSAITRQEGANPSYNNPGNLRAGPGQTGTSPNGIAIFPDFATGEAALERQVQLNIDRGLTLSQFFAGRGAPGDPNYYGGYAPAADRNQPNVYTQHVSEWTGIDPSIPLNQVSGASPTIGTPSPASGDSSSDPLLSDLMPDSFSVGDVSPLVIGIAAGLAILAVVMARS